MLTAFAWGAAFFVVTFAVVQLDPYCALPIVAFLLVALLTEEAW